MMYADEVRGSVSTACRKLLVCCPSTPHTMITCGYVFAIASKAVVFTAVLVVEYGTAYSAGAAISKEANMESTMLYSESPKEAPVRYMKAVRRARSVLIT
ncbi:hypothetical protein NESM_000922800 [Novymonas esmeraldas]|uniref:Uncharacterized protein n=1 Tax=Novymonas esmeraldas TaxID=1808958 RepID=A0AAW0F2M4_9TRYP